MQPARVLALAALVVFCASTVAVGAASGQSLSPSGVVARVDTTPDANTGSWHLEQCIMGLTYGAPLKLAASYGAGFLHESNGGPDVCVPIIAKVGFGGAQGSMGIGTSFAPWGTGVMLTGNVLRTFSGALNATGNRTYVGTSLHIWPALALGGEIGYFWRMGDAPGESTAGKKIWSWSAGFGF
jgi:hypothetical protein